MHTTEKRYQSYHHHHHHHRSYSTTASEKHNMTTNIPTITCIIVWPTMLLFMFLIMTLPFLLEGIEALSTTTTTTSIITGTDTPPLLDSPVWSMATLNKKDDHDDDNKENKSSSSKQQQTTNMNLLTYATPVSIRPHRLYALGLFQKTLSRDNFLREKVCILQLLSADNEEHLSCIPLLGGQSGNDIDKEHALLKHTQLQTLPTPTTTTTTTTTTTRDKSTKDQDQDGDEEVPLLPKVLPGCVQYLKLILVGNCDDIIKHDDDNNDNDNDEASSHDVVICKVEEMWTSTSTSTSTVVETEKEEEEGTNHDDDEPQQQEEQHQQLHHHLSTRRLRQLGLITEQGRIADRVINNESTS